MYISKHFSVFLKCHIINKYSVMILHVTLYIMDETPKAVMAEMK